MGANRAAAIDGDSGERGRLARNVWRPAKHIPHSKRFEHRAAPYHRSKKSMKSNPPGSVARDAPRGDRDGRAPQV